MVIEDARGGLVAQRDLFHGDAVFGLIERDGRGETVNRDVLHERGAHPFAQHGDAGQAAAGRGFQADGADGALLVGQEVDAHGGGIVVADIDREVFDEIAEAGDAFAKRAVGIAEAVIVGIERVGAGADDRRGDAGIIIAGGVIPEPDDGGLARLADQAEAAGVIAIRPAFYQRAGNQICADGKIDHAAGGVLRAAIGRAGRQRGVNGRGVVADAVAIGAEILDVDHARIGRQVDAIRCGAGSQWRGRESGGDNRYQH